MNAIKKYHHWCSLGGQRYKAGVSETRELGAMNDRKRWEKPQLEHQKELVERRGCALAAGL